MTGGSKKQVKTVSKLDIEDLQKQIINKANDHISKDIASKLDKNIKIINDLNKVDISKTVLNHELGEEADNVTNKSTVVITYITFNEPELRHILGASFKKDSTNNLIVQDDKINYKINKVAEKDKPKLEIEAKVTLTADIKKDKVLKEIVGKSTNSAAEIVKSQFKATSMEFEIKSPVPLLNSNMPFFQKNIDLRISYK